MDALFAEADLPFGHPRRNFDGTLPDFDCFEDCHEPPVDPPREGTVHYGPGHRPLCGNADELALYTRDPHQVAGCDDCLELVVEDLADDNKHGGYCLHCGHEITAQGGVAWRRTVRNPCPHCGRPGW